MATWATPRSGKSRWRTAATYRARERLRTAQAINWVNENWIWWTGTVPANGVPRRRDEWVLPEAASANATAGGREYGYGDRSDAEQEGCFYAAFFAGISLLFLLFAVCIVCAMSSRRCGGHPTPPAAREPRAMATRVFKRKQQNTISLVAAAPSLELGSAQ